MILRGAAIVASVEFGNICTYRFVPASLGQSKRLTMSVRDTYVRVQEAAKILGVVPNTVRKWGATGKIPEYRNPANDFRLYKREELEAFLRRIESSRKTTHKTKR